MPEEDWELIPHKVLADLRDEVHLLKEKLNQPSTRTDAIKSNDELRKSIQQMQKVFETALSQVDKEEDSDVSKRLEAIEKQNEQIAKALVSIVDMVEGKSRPKIPSPPTYAPEPPRMNAPVNIPPPPARPIQTQKMPSFPPRPPRRMPKVDMNEPRFPPPPPMGMPPPPPLPEKKGLLGKLFK